MTLCHTFYTFTRIVMLIKQFVRKNAFNGEVFLGKLFQEKVNARLVAEHLKLFVQVHLLNEGGLYKMDQTQKLLLQFYYITR